MIRRALASLLLRLSVRAFMRRRYQRSLWLERAGERVAGGSR